jgi:CRP-like cAMP-binding protein
MLNFPDDLHQNHLLAALPPSELRALIPHLRLVHLKCGQLLSDSGQPIKAVYFPTTAVISLLCLMKDGASVEVAAVGREGVAGVPVLTGGNAMPSRIEVSSEGYGYALNAQHFKHEFERSALINRLMLLYIQALMTQIAQSALCNRRHSVDEQLCRWLLLAHDRQQADDLVTTQQMIAYTLGVRREGVTEAAGKLESAGLIRRGRGHITVLDREGLKRRTCDCYSIIKGEFQRLLPSQPEVVTHPSPAVAARAPFPPAAATRQPVHAM